MYNRPGPSRSSVIQERQNISTSNNSGSSQQSSSHHTAHPSIETNSTSSQLPQGHHIRQLRFENIQSPQSVRHLNARMSQHEIQNPSVSRLGVISGLSLSSNTTQSIPRQKTNSFSSDQSNSQLPRFGSSDAFSSQKAIMDTLDAQETFQF